MRASNSAMFFLLALFAAASAFPRTNPTDDTEVLFVPLEAREGATESAEDADDSTETDSVFGLFPVGPFSFGGFNFMQGFEDLMRKMTEVLKSIPEQAFNLGKEGNTTSTTKVVGGHVVTVNETVYTNDDNTGTYKIQVIEVRPTEGAGEESELNPGSSTELEPVQGGSDSDNEIPKGKTEAVAERFDRSYSENTELLETPEFYPFVYEVDNSIDPEREIDLAGDILINDKLNGMVMIDPDAELIDVINGQVIEPSRLQRIQAVLA